MTTEKIDQPPFHWRSLASREVRFSGSIRQDEGGALETFAGKDQQGAVSYGEFETRYRRDQATYDVLVKSFGYRGEHNVGNPSPGARRIFSRAEANAMRRAIAELSSAKAERPFPLHGAGFSGRVVFERNWIRTSPLRVLGLAPREIAMFFAVMFVIGACIAAAAWWSVTYQVPPWLYQSRS